jgi:hypothetical protein
MQSRSKPVWPKKSAGRFKRKGFLGALLGLMTLCLVGTMVSWWSNRNLPMERVTPNQIVPLDKIRLAETLHLKDRLGESLWPGFGYESIPICLHYDQVSFLVGYPGLPPAAWEVVSGDHFLDQPYYRKAETDPQNYAIQIGEQWVAGMATKTRTDQFLIQVFRDLLPPVVEQVFPYRLLIQPSETQIAAVIHESFHVYQARRAPERLEAAEAAHRVGELYWIIDEDMHEDWKAEVNLLIRASEAETDVEARELAAQFLDARQNRRRDAALEQNLVDFERWLEWEEGLAKYAEIKILQFAFESSTYQPIPEIAADPEFKSYQGFKNRWSQEMIQLRLQAAQEGASRFYQTGLALASLLDRLSDGWQEKVWEQDVFLEDLLQAAVK